MKERYSNIIGSKIDYFQTAFNSTREVDKWTYKIPSMENGEKVH